MLQPVSQIGAVASFARRGLRVKDGRSSFGDLGRSCSLSKGSWLWEQSRKHQVRFLLTCPDVEHCKSHCRRLHSLRSFVQLLGSCEISYCDLFSGFKGICLRQSRAKTRTKTLWFSSNWQNMFQRLWFFKRAAASVPASKKPLPSPASVTHAHFCCVPRDVSSRVRNRNFVLWERRSSAPAETADTSFPNHQTLYLWNRHEKESLFYRNV